MVVNIPVPILDDLCSRFLVNLPKEELTNPVRVCFQIELAHWFYTDFYKPDDANSPNCGLRDFIRIIFNHLPCLKQHATNIDAIIEEWRQYKTTVPTYGAICIDESEEFVLLVQGFYATSRWGFPKGKVNQEEPPHLCAIREVREETGFDISSLIQEDVWIEKMVSDTRVRLYLVFGVPKDFAFHPETRNEIRDIRWFRVDDLPTNKFDNSKNALGLYANNFYGVLPFVNGVKQHICERKGLPYCYSTNTLTGCAVDKGYRNAGADGQHARVSRQRTQSCGSNSTGFAENGAVFDSNYYSANVHHVNGYSKNNHNNCQGGSTTPKSFKHQQQSQQQQQMVYQNSAFKKQQKNLPKQRLRFDELAECTANSAASSYVQVNGNAKKSDVGPIYLVDSWKNVQFDWKRILA